MKQPLVFATHTMLGLSVALCLAAGAAVFQHAAQPQASVASQHASDEHDWNGDLIATLSDRQTVIAEIDRGPVTLPSGETIRINASDDCRTTQRYDESRQISITCRSTQPGRQDVSVDITQRSQSQHTTGSTYLRLDAAQEVTTSDAE